MSIANSTGSVSTLYGSGNRVLQTAYQGSTYEEWAWTTPLLWDASLSRPTPTGSAIVPPTVGVEYPHDLFTGVADGYWVYHLFLGGHHQHTFTFSDQVFAVTVPFDRVESVAMGGSTIPGPYTGPVRGDCGPDVPAPAGAAVLLCAALFTRFRNRKA